MSKLDPGRLFTPVYDDISRRIDITPSQKLIYSRIVRYGDIRPSEAMLAVDCGVTTRTVSTALTALQNLGLLDADRNLGKKRRNRYVPAKAEEVSEIFSSEDTPGVTPGLPRAEKISEEIHPTCLEHRKKLRQNPCTPIETQYETGLEIQRQTGAAAFGSTIRDTLAATGIPINESSLVDLVDKYSEQVVCDAMSRNAREIRLAGNPLAKLRRILSLRLGRAS